MTTSREWCSLSSPIPSRKRLADHLILQSLYPLKHPCELYTEEAPLESRKLSTHNGCGTGRTYVGWMSVERLNNEMLCVRCGKWKHIRGRGSPTLSTM